MSKVLTPRALPEGKIFKTFVPNIKVEGDPKINEIKYIGSLIFKDEIEAKDFAGSQIAFIYATGTYDKYWIE